MVITPDSLFEYEDAEKINRARLDHLDTLGLELNEKSVLEVGCGIGKLTRFFEDRSCSILSTEVRDENINVFRKRYPDRRIEKVNISEKGSHDRFGSFDIVFMYGVLYHLGDPSSALADLSKLCKSLFLLETVVDPFDKGEINFIQENHTSYNQSFEGKVCRPSRKWVFNELKKHFEYVYITATQPNHGQFPLGWPVENPTTLTRSIFVASRSKLGGNQFITSIPKSQRYVKNNRVTLPKHKQYNKNNLITLVTSVFNPPSQCNLSALYSWELIGVPVIVVAKGLQKQMVPYENIRVISEVRTEKEFGANGDSPHLRNMLERALGITETPMVGLINADIILRPDFIDRLEAIVKRHGEHVFFTSVRNDTKFPGQISSREQYSAVWGQPRKLHQDKSADLFISSKREFLRMVDSLPDFIYARTVWDNWIHSYFKGSGIECFNTSEQLEILHLSHDYAHLKGDLSGHKSVRHNLSYAKKMSFISIGDWPQP